MRLGFGERSCSQPVGYFEGEQAVANSIASVRPFIIFGGIAGFILYFVTIFNLRIASITAPLYALCEGFVLGGASAIFELSYPGIAMQAVALTFGTLFCMLMGYKSGRFRLSEKMKLGLFAAVGGIFAVYFVGWIMSFFGAQIPLIHGSGPVGIGFSLLVVIVAAVFLLIDFELIERFAQQGSPKYMEWYGAMALMVTLIWLYLEILILLSKLRGGRR